MTSLSIILLVVCILEAILIIWLIQKRPKTQDGESEAEAMRISEIEKAFKNNGYEVKQLSLGSMEEHLRTFKLRIQNEDYETAEQRVVAKMDVFLTELWRLKYIEHNEIADSFLVLIRNTMNIRVTEDVDIEKTIDSEKQFIVQRNYIEGSRLQVIIPAIFYKRIMVKRGTAKCV